MELRDWYTFIRKDKSYNFGLSTDCYDFIEMTHDKRCLDDDDYTDAQDKLMPFIKRNPVVVLSFLAKQAVQDYLYRFDSKMDFYPNAEIALQARARHPLLGQSSNNGFKEQDIRIPDRKTEEQMNIKLVFALSILDSGTKATASDLDTESSDGTGTDSDNDSMPELESDVGTPLATVTPIPDRKFIPPVDLKEAYNSLDVDEKGEQETNSEDTEMTGVTQVSCRPKAKAANIIITQDQFERIMRKHGKPIMGLTREDKEKAILDLKHNFKWGRTGENPKIRIIENMKKQKKQMKVKVHPAQSSAPTGQPVNNHSMTPWSQAKRWNIHGITGNPVYYSSNLDWGCKSCPKKEPAIYTSEIDVVRLYKEFVAQCHKCEHYHIDPFCKCGAIRTNSSMCSCGRIALWDCYKGKCYQCSEIHHYPACGKCEKFRRFPGPCVYCGHQDDEDRREETKNQNNKVSCVYKLHSRFRERHIRNCHNNKLMEGDLGFQRPVIHCVKCQGIHTGILHSCKDGLNQRTNAEITELTTYEERVHFDTVLGHTIREDTRRYAPYNFGNGEYLTSLPDDAYPTFKVKFNREALERSLIKITPHGFDNTCVVRTICNCYWCGSSHHFTNNCNGYLEWVQSCSIALANTTPQNSVKIKQQAYEELNAHYDISFPWRLYINLPDGEYHTRFSIPILVKDKRILNSIPHHHQVSTMAYALLPTPAEIGNLYQLSSKLVPSRTLWANPGYGKNSPTKLILAHQKRTDDQHSDLLEKTEDIHQLTEKIKEELIEVRSDLEEKIQESVSKICTQFTPATDTTAHVVRPTRSNEYNREYVYKGDSDPSIPPWLFLHHRLRRILDPQEFIPLHHTEAQREVHLQCIEAVLLAMKELLTQFNLCDDGQSKGLYLFFEKAIREFLDEGRINFNDVVNFVQQILYLDQCELEPTLENFELELQTGLLAQCFYKEWEIEDTDEWHPRDLLLAYPGVEKVSRQFFHRLKLVRLQSCMCSSHKHDPLKRCQPYAGREIPTFRTIMNMAFGKEWICDPSNIRVYVDVIKNWIFARLFSYMTPYFPPYLKNGCRHIAEEIHFSADEKKLFRTHTAAKDDYYRVMQRLTMAKKTSCTCDPHHVIRVLGLMNLLKVTEVDGPFGAVYSILAIMVRHAPIGYTFTVTVDACLQDDFDPSKDKCVKYLYWVRYDINSMFSLTLCDTIKQDNHTCDGVLTCVNNMDHIADHSVKGHSLKNVHGQVRLLKIPGKIPESGNSEDAGASATPAPQRPTETEASQTPDSLREKKTEKTSPAANADPRGKAKFYSEEIKERFPVLYAWLSTMDRIPHLSDGSDSDEDKSEFRYGIRYQPNNDSSEDDKKSSRTTLNDLD